MKPTTFFIYLASAVTGALVADYIYMSTMESADEWETIEQENEEKEQAEEEMTAKINDLVEPTEDTPTLPEDIVTAYNKIKKERNKKDKEDDQSQPGDGIYFPKKSAKPVIVTEEEVTENTSNYIEVELTYDYETKQVFFNGDEPISSTSKELIGQIPLSLFYSKKDIIPVYVRNDRTLAYYEIHLENAPSTAPRKESINSD
jgi:hypothetical protein